MVGKVTVPAGPTTYPLPASTWYRNNTIDGRIHDLNLSAELEQLGPGIHGVDAVSEFEEDYANLNPMMKGRT